MATACFRFYEELNDFLTAEKRKRDNTVHFDQRNSVKDFIEAMGVPHTEVDLILVNGEPVDFSYIVLQNDRISVYPVFETLDISPLNRLRPEPLRKPRFVLDTHLGKLARYLRLLGFDTLYDNHYTDAELTDISDSGEKRILLTRDKGLLKRKRITHGYFVRETNPERQTSEVLKRFDLIGSAKPFSRCLSCNAILTVMPLEDAVNRVPPGVRERHQEFAACPDCRRAYWKGSHYHRLRELVASLLDASSPERPGS